MVTRLTPEFADSVHLSLNPIKRHVEVDAMLNDPAIVGNEVKVLANPSMLNYNPDEEARILIIYTMLPILGRHALRKAATSLGVM